MNLPSRYVAHVPQNAFTVRRDDDIEGLIEQTASQSRRWTIARAAGDMDVVNAFVGEVVGLVNSMEPAGARFMALLLKLNSC